MTDEPREFTSSEIRDQFLRHCHSMARYWANVDLSGPEFAEAVAQNGEMQYRTEGAIFSMLVALDGGSMGLPGFLVVPYPHPDDKQYHIDEGENWYPPVDDKMYVKLCDISHGCLHEFFHERKTDG